MRVRLLKDLLTTTGYLKAGTIVNVPDFIGRSWCKAEKAMEDKSFEPPETKGAPFKIIPDRTKRKKKRVRQ